MLKSNELRRGNLLGYDGEHLPVDTIHSDETIRFKKGEDSIGCFPLSRAYPIPLTDEWYKKFELINGTTQALELVTNAHIIKDYVSGYSLYLGGAAIRVKLKYVHQLQNIYHSFTDEELKYTL